MASTPLTLAALATSAVPQLHVVGVRPHTDSGAGDYTSVVVVAEEGEFIVQVPNTPAAEVRQSGELLGLAALAEGARSSLPFQVPLTQGMTRAGDTRAVVSTFLPGGRVSAEDLESDALLLQPVAESIAAIHSLPLSLIHQGGLPVRSAEDARELVLRLVERAAATRLLPEAVHRRWLDLLGAAAIWDFAPTVVHGSLEADQLLVADDTVVGVLGWSELSVGDPAIDLAWLLAAGTEVLDSVLSRYAAIRGIAGMRELRTRAILQHELGVARWLLFGIDHHDNAIVDDAVAMLDRLVDQIVRTGAPVEHHRPLTEGDVQQLLEEIPEIPYDPRSETAEFEALDEDREFSADPDFRDLPEHPAQAEPLDQSHEHATEPIDPADLPDGSGGTTR